MVSCVVEPLKSEAKCPKNLRRDLKWYLSEIGLSNNNIYIIIYVIIHRKRSFCLLFYSG